MVEMNDRDNRGQGNSYEAVTHSVRAGDPHWKLERLDAIHRQLLTGLAAVGELYRLQDVWTTYSGLVRHQRPDAPHRITAAELLAELKPCATTGNRDDVLEFANALRLLKGLRAEIDAMMSRPLSAEATTCVPAPALASSNPTVHLDVVAQDQLPASASGVAGSRAPWLANCERLHHR
jgi:hypothetical protein